VAPGQWVNVSIAGVASGRVKSHATTGAWSFTAPRLATSVHDVSAVAENRAGIRSAATSFRLTVNGERTVMLDGSGGKPVELTASHLLGQGSQGFIVTQVHRGTLQKWVAAANAWQTIPAQRPTNSADRLRDLADVRATGNAAELRTIAFTDTVRWIPSSDHVGIASAFTILPLDKAGGAIALPPQPGTVPGKVGSVIIGDCSRDLPTTIMWNAPTDGCGCRSTRYSVEVLLEDGRTLLYNVPSTVSGGSSVDVTGGSIADVGAVLSFRIWGATKRGAGEVLASSASSSYAIALESFQSTSRSSCNTCNPSSCPPDICSGYGTPVCCPSGSGSTTCCATGGGR
jgi:hypothetical protein